ncbi:MAG: rhombotarget lipoprotein [Gemmatimonadota bacterium]
MANKRQQGGIGSCPADGGSHEEASMPRRCITLTVVVSLALLTASCATSKRLRTSALDFLYPKGTEAIPPTDVRLTLPVRVGIAFAPSQELEEATFTEVQKQSLLSRIKAAFEGQEGISSVEVIPSSYLSPQGGFENLDRLAVAFGIDLVALVSYDQVQFSESGRGSLAYWTLVGAYFIKGEKNETRTLLDAVVYSIPSRAMLFHATGQSGSRGRSTPFDVPRDLRRDSARGFEQATEDLIANLGEALQAFREQVATGTVRGPGTPEIAVYDPSGEPVRTGGTRGGAGAHGPSDLVAAAVLLSLGLLARWGRRG